MKAARIAADAYSPEVDVLLIRRRFTRWAVSALYTGPLERHDGVAMATQSNRRVEVRAVTRAGALIAGVRRLLADPAVPGPVAHQLMRLLLRIAP